MMIEDPDSPSSRPSHGHDRDLNIDIAIIERDPDWRGLHPACEALCRTAVLAACREGLEAHQDLGGGTAAELAVVLADDDFVRELNRLYRGKDAATNVLAFAHREMADDPVPIPASDTGGDPGQALQFGDVVLARQTLLREAAAQCKAPEDHLRHLVVHGVLHLLGYDHQIDADAAVMEAHEVAALAGLGIADPYADDRRPLEDRVEESLLEGKGA